MSTGRDIPIVTDVAARLRQRAGEFLACGAVPVIRRAPLTVCILGGTGFVGRELVRRLALDGHWVRLPTRSLANAAPLRVLDTVQAFVANVHDRQVLRELVTGADLVINLVGILNEGGGHSFQSAHADLAGKVVATAREAQVPRLLHMSSLGAALDAPSRYLRSKAAAEAAVRAAGPPLAWTLFRPSVIFGPDDSLTNRFARLLRVSGGFLPLARAGARFAPIHVLDVVEAFMRALHDPGTIGQTYELCGPDVLSLEALVRECARAAAPRCHVLRLPDALGRLQAAVLGLLPGKPFSSDNFRSLTRDSICGENGCARLGLAPRHFIGAAQEWLAPSMPAGTWQPPA